MIASTLDRANGSGIALDEFVVVFFDLFAGREDRERMVYRFWTTFLKSKMAGTRSQMMGTGGWGNF
jgi:hypothetical protein